MEASEQDELQRDIKSYQENQSNEVQSSKNKNVENSHRGSHKINSKGNSLIYKSAKQYFQMINYDFDKLQQWDDYQSLGQEDLTKLQTFKYNQAKKQRQKQKVEEETTPSIFSTQNKKMAVKMSRFEKELQAVQFCKTQDEKQCLFTQLKNQWGVFEFNVFLKFLHQSGIKDMIFSSLFNLIQLEDDMDDKKILLLQASLFYDGQSIDIDQKLISLILQDFKFMEDELDQCFGFIQILFENNSAAFSQLQLSRISELEKEMPRLPVLLSIFIKQYMNPTLQQLFPSTLMCLTPPLVQEIKLNKGQQLTYNVPFEWVEEYVCLITYSFETNIDNFNNFINKIQLKHFNFSCSISYILKMMIQRDNKWIGQLQNVLNFFSTIIEQIILQKEQRINCDIIQKVLQQDYQLIENIPDNKFINEIKEKQYQFLEQVELMNSRNDKFTKFIEKFQFGEIQNEIQQLVSLTNIDMLHPIQEICVSYILKSNHAIFSIIGIGNGKTLICNLLAAYYSKIKKQKVAILNKSPNLSQRNAIIFEQTFAEQLELIVALDYSQNQIDYNVIFICENELQKLIKDKNIHFDQFVLICDEADAIIFPDEPKDFTQKELEKQRDKILFFKQFAKFYCFTGTITNEEKEIIRAVITNDIIIYPEINYQKNLSIKKIKEEVYSTKDEWLLSLSKEISQKSLITPIIVLTQENMDKQIIKNVNSLSNNQVQIQSLIGKTPNQIITTTQSCIIRDQARGYPVFLVDEGLGRGLDFKTSPQIEENGGIYVILSKIPSTQKIRDQVIGRTQRRLFKGQYSIIVNNTFNKSIETIINEGNNKIIFNLKKLIQNLKHYFKQELQGIDCKEEERNKNKIQKLFQLMMKLKLKNQQIMMTNIQIIKVKSYH